MPGYTPEDLSNISAAIASGLTQATIQGETAVYRNLDEMLRIKKLIEKDLSSVPGIASFPIRYPFTGRGV